MIVLSAALLGFSSGIIFPFLPYTILHENKSLNNHDVNYLNFSIVISWKLCPLWGVVSRLVVSFLIASLCLLWCWCNLCCVFSRQKFSLFFLMYQVLGRMSNKCAWAKQYRFHKLKALCKNQSAPPALGLWSSEEWEPGVVGVALGWCDPRAGPLQCKVEPAIAASAAPVPASPGTSCTYMIHRRAFLTVVGSGTLPTVDKQHVSELVRFN